MTKSTFLLIAICLIFNSCQNYQKSTPTKEGTNDSIQLTNKRILFLGNSITQNGLYVSLIEYGLQKLDSSQKPDIISIGLSSETVSGLTEPTHPFPRPNLLARIDSALAKVKPDIVVATYGINDGIYHPPSAERLLAYQNGIRQVIQKVKNINAELILLSPTPFDALPIENRLVGLDAPEFGYRYPYRDYDQVLSEYSAWLNTLDGKAMKVIDWHTTINQSILEKRKTDPTFSYAKDGIHPNEEGHFLMAQIFLDMLIPINSRNHLSDYQSVSKDTLFTKIHQQRVNRSERWRNYIGYTRGKTVKSIAPNSLLILMGGQSNMSGLAQKKDLQSTKLPKNIDFIDYGLNAKKVLMDQQFGPEYGLSKQLNQAFPHQHFTLLKYSIGGASLLDWAPNYSKEKAEITGNAKFGNMYATLFQKIESIEEKEIQPTAFLWMQGERDARIPEAGKDYYENFKKLILAIRKDLNHPTLPFIFGMVNPPAERYAALETVRTAQRQIAKDLQNVYIVETDDLEKLKDNLHYNTAGQLELGKRFGEKVIQLLR